MFYFGKAAAKSAAMRTVLGTLSRLAASDLTITLMGETGAGKDVLAHAVHEHSPRSAAPFIVFDCGAVPANLAESELFGHERGAFTGAHSSHVGAFERANGGTFFLDEIGELPLELQPRLLRALENRGVRRVGGADYRPVDTRIVAATNRDLRARVEARHFREDLYFRLATAVVYVPPLRETLDDLPLLVPRLLEALGYPQLDVAPKTYELLRDHHWPGNVRELKNALSAAAAFVEGTVLEPAHMRFLVTGDGESRLPLQPLGGKSLESLEILGIRQTLARHDGNKRRTAESLGISLSALYEKLKKYEIEVTRR